MILLVSENIVVWNTMSSVPLRIIPPSSLLGYCVWDANSATRAVRCASKDNAAFFRAGSCRFAQQTLYHGQTVLRKAESLTR